MTCSQGATPRPKDHNVPSIRFRVVVASHNSCVGRIGERKVGWHMTSTRYAVLLLTATAVATIPRPSLAQSAGDGFLFHVPVATWTVRGGFDHAFASGDIFNFVTKQLTIDRSDFSSATFGTNVAVRVSPANDLVFDVGFSNVSRNSEFRRWVDQNNQPILQTTSLRKRSEEHTSELQSPYALVCRLLLEKKK